MSTLACCRISPNEYQTFANGLASEQSDIVVAALGLAGESGEVCDHLKKHFGQGHELNHAKLIDEAGDVQWYLALLCRELKITLEDLMLRNVQKLSNRYPDGFSSERSQDPFRDVSEGVLLHGAVEVPDEGPYIDPEAAE